MPGNVRWLMAGLAAVSLSVSCSQIQAKWQQHGPRTPLHRDALSPLSEDEMDMLRQPKASDCQGYLSRCSVEAQANVRQRLREGYRVDARDYFGRTPLFRVVSAPVAELLIAQGADVNARDLAGRTPCSERRMPLWPEL